jgi:hypothetical protein
MRRQVEDHGLPAEIRALTGQATCPLGDAALAFNDMVLAAETCEELFTPAAPHIALALSGVEVISNGSGSHHQVPRPVPRDRLPPGGRGMLDFRLEWWLVGRQLGLIGMHLVGEPLGLVRSFMTLIRSPCETPPAGHLLARASLINDVRWSWLEGSWGWLKAGGVDLKAAGVKKQPAGGWLEASWGWLEASWGWLKGIWGSSEGSWGLSKKCHSGSH